MFAGDNFLRHSGEAPEVQKLQLFAWNAAARGNDVHMNANPTQGQLLHEQYQKKKEELKDTNKVSILEKYGGEQYLEKAPRELLQGQTEEYIEFSRTGQVIKGKERAMARSKYPEDGRSFIRLFDLPISHVSPVYVNNHTSVWGSFYDSSTGEWGFACCHSIVHLSYCTGHAGINATQASSAQNLLASSSRQSPPPPSDEPPSSSRTTEKSSVEDRKKKAEELYSKRRLGEGELSLDQSRLAQAIREEKKRKGRADEDDPWDAKRKKGGDKYEVTEEELGTSNKPPPRTESFYSASDLLYPLAEAYRMNRRMTEDPMANYVDDDI